MHHYRLWIELEDRAGQLAAAATTLAEVGGNIESVDVHVLDEDHVADDLVVGLPRARRFIPAGTGGGAQGGAPHVRNDLDQLGRTWKPWRRGG